MSEVLHMDIEAVLAIIKELHGMQGQLTSYTQTLGNHVYGLPPDWQGHSAVEFFNEYELWASAVTGVSGSLGDIADHLEQAVANWEAADSTF